MSKKVFIFDDNKDILDLCTLILEGAGYETKTSSTSNDIIAQVSVYEPDIILMDNWLPDVGGIEATQELKRHPVYKEIPVIYFSANNDIKTLAATAGAERYLPKPFDIDELEGMVVSLIGR
ncbi:MAG: response regulator [Pedobacter sp.]|uniref:response regulator n=1 Tax=Pedobacter sp. TaxID=1411316 RepID=UPI002807295C|nr:response regulator [Pedobacter sp.]MDQ8005112.1 response regulator [Pedobacter sp.]